MVWDFDQWYAKVKENEGVVTDELFEEVQTGAKEGWMRQDDYNRSLNNKDKEIKAREAEIARVREEQVSWWNQNKPALDQLRKYQQAYGDLSEFTDGGGGTMNTPSGDTVTKAEYMKVVDMVQKLGGELDTIRTEATSKVTALERQTNNLLTASSELAYSHFQEFNEPLNLAKLTSFIKDQNEQGVQFGSFNEAYSSMVKPLRDKKAVEEQENWKKTTRQEIERDLRSNLQVPPAGNPQDAGFFTETRHLRQKEENPNRPSRQEIRASVLQSMRESRTGGTG